MGQLKSKFEDASNNLSISMFEYEKQSNDELTLKKNDKLKITKEFNNDYYLAKNVRNHQKGLVKKEFVVPYNSLENRSWYFPNCSRQTAEKQLVYGQQMTGTFLVHNSGNDDNYFLSVLLNEDKVKMVKHYQILKKGHTCFYIDSKRIFYSLDDLIEYYSNNSLNDCGPLVRPCEKELKSDSINQISNTIYQINKNPFTQLNGLFEGYINEDVPVLIKTYSTSTNLNQFDNELKTLKKIEHKNILKILAVFKTSAYILVCTEFMANYDLNTYVRMNKINKKILIKVAKQLCSALTYLMRRSIIHRDLRCKNVFISHNNFVKLGNFGLARELDYSNQYREEMNVKESLSLKWMAPEILRPNQKDYRVFTEKSEVWSLGMLLFEMINKGEEPFKEIREDALSILIIENHYRPCFASFEEPIEIFYEKILLNCWHIFPSFRPTFSYLSEMFINYFDLIEVDYYQQFNNSTLENAKEYKKMLDEDVGQVNADEVNLAVILSSNEVFEMWKGNFRFDDFIVSIKKLKCFQTNKKEFIFNYQNFLHEFKIMQKLNHPNIIKLFGICSINPYYLIIEYMKLGPLDNVLKQMSSLTFENNEFLLYDLVCIACDISNGLRYLEYQNIVHADLRVKHILIDSNSDKNSSKRYLAKIFSFDKSIQLGNKESIEMPCTNYVRQRKHLRWSAPETVLPNKRNSLVYSIKSDVYSFGMVLYEIITLGLLPFQDIEENQVYDKVFLENYFMNKPVGLCTERYYFLMKECWQYDFLKRPKFSNLFTKLANYQKDIELEIKSPIILNTEKTNDKHQIIDKLMSIKNKSRKYNLNKSFEINTKSVPFQLLNNNLSSSDV